MGSSRGLRRQLGDSTVKKVWRGKYQLFSSNTLGNIQMIHPFEAPKIRVLVNFARAVSYANVESTRVHMQNAEKALRARGEAISEEESRSVFARNYCMIWARHKRCFKPRSRQKQSVRDFDKKKEDKIRQEQEVLTDENAVIDGFPKYRRKRS
ncbi:predicted protein [Nematostella vectensis]|uniref:Uncharacterized protein n=1 Tax=Nematostella vectensis TaxID=45351 RepID=A7SEM1_NEMVE|nr:predicted protein [Nematostella vectensis]|eukprot:XP_001629901.1 predicted protein [Nematostella vectensis]